MSTECTSEEGPKIVLESPIEENLGECRPSEVSLSPERVNLSDSEQDANQHNRHASLEGADLTGEDILSMKRLTKQRSGTVSDMADQSIISQVDSTSNFDEHVPASTKDSLVHTPHVASDVSSEAGSNEIPSPVCLLHATEDSQREEDTSAKTERSGERTGLIEQGRIYAGFVFDRQRPPNPELNKETVTVLSYPFEPTAIPAGEDVKEYREALAAAKVYLVGTAHFSPDSQQDVLKTIANTQPDMVMVELCPSRISILSMDEDTLLREAQSLNIEKVMATVKQNGAVQGILHVLLLSMSAHITRELGMAPGGEFRAAHRGAMNVKLCKLILGDRPIHVTLQRALGSLGFFQKVRVFYHLLLSHKSSITQEEVERCKQSDMLEELLKEMAGEFPLLSKIFVEERDLYMTNALHTLLRKTTFDKRVAWSKTDAAWQPVSVVAVVGIGHVPGIVSNWNKTIDVGNLLSIPPPSRKAKVFRFAVKGLILGATVYATYRIGSRVFSKVKAFMK